MITKHFFKMVITFIGVLLVGIVVLFIVSIIENKEDTDSVLAPVTETTIDLNN